MSDKPHWHRYCIRDNGGASTERSWPSGVFILLLVMLVIAQMSFCGRALADQPTSPAYWSLQFTNWPSLPYNPFPNAASFLLGANNIAYDDRDVDYGQLAAHQSSLEPPPPPGEGGGGGGGGQASEAYGYGSNVLWIEIYAVTNDLAYMTLHNTRSNKWYQLLSKPALDPGYWKPGQVVFNDIGTNQIYFDPVPTEQLATTFYRGAEGNWKVRIIPDGHAYEPNTPLGLSGIPAQFLIYSDVAMTNALPVVYLIGGSALNGTDYETNSSPATIPASSDETSVPVTPYEDSLVEFDENVILRLVVTNGYVVEPSQSKATVWISDQFGTNQIFSTVAAGLTQVAGIDYHPPTQSLLVSQYYDSTADGWNFIRINTNGVITNWSKITHLGEEKKLCVVQQPANGFTQGEMYFGTLTNGVIGKISADGSETNMSWAVLTTNNMEANSLIRGSLYIDQTGIFGHDLIAVTGGNESQGGEIWRVNSSGGAALIQNITNNPNPHLEGVVTLPDDVQKYGPWAGRIITGAESAVDANNLPKPLIDSVDRNGIATSFAFSIAPEDFDIIPTNQDLYITSYNEGRILKLSQLLLTNYWGDILITQEATRLFIVHWNMSKADFDIRRIAVETECGTPNGLEHVTFAPITLTNIPCQ